MHLKIISERIQDGYACLFVLLERGMSVTIVRKVREGAEQWDIESEKRR